MRTNQSHKPIRTNQCNQARAYQTHTCKCIPVRTNQSHKPIRTNQCNQARACKTQAYKCILVRKNQSHKPVRTNQCTPSKGIPNSCTQVHTSAYKPVTQTSTYKPVHTKARAYQTRAYKPSSVQRAIPGYGSQHKTLSTQSTFQ